MKKVLYSMMLDEDVINQIDVLAHKAGTNRSAMVNRILAEHVNLTTPERRVSDIFNSITALLDGACGLVPNIAQNAMSMSLKSSLQYRYRPTLKYEVEFYRTNDDYLGQLTVKLRTQSELLISQLSEFFKAWKAVEEHYLARPVNCVLNDLKFVRALSAPERACSADELAAALHNYVTTLDAAIKKYLADDLSMLQLQRMYANYLANTDIKL